MSEQLSAADARGIAVRAQGFANDISFADPLDMLDHLAAVQLDTISVVARSHELITYARLGPIGRQAVEGAYWHSGQTFEYQAHAACILPMRLWPSFAFRRRAWQSRTTGGAIEPGVADARREVDRSAYREVRARLAEGPISVDDVGGGRSSPGWWNWSEAKLALEVMYLRGELACTTRNGWKRVYDLAERVIPGALLAQEPSDEECIAALVAEAARGMGVATKRDFAEYWTLTRKSITGPVPWAKLVQAGIEAAGLVPVEVEGWKEPAFADPEALTNLSAPVHAPRLLSPFDSLIWAPRERTERVFDFAFQLEAYVPKAKRVDGYYMMPLLADGRLVARVDPAREGMTLVARRIRLEDPLALEELAAALKETASWVACDTVRIEELEPAAMKPSLERLVA